MSFFGFDPTGPPSKRDDELYDFEETYEGLGEHPIEADDAMNAETFGDDVDIGKDFDFGHGSAPAAPAPGKPKMSYANAAAQPVEDILQPMASLWGSSENTNIQPQIQQQQQPQAQMAPQAEKILSLEEIESQLMGGDSSQAQAQHQMPPQHQMYPPPGAFPNFMLPPGAPGFPPPQMMYNNQPFPFPPLPMGMPPQFQHQMPPQQMPQQGSQQQFPPQHAAEHQQQPQQVPQQASQQIPQPQAPQQQQQAPQQQAQQQHQQAPKRAPVQVQQRQQRPDLSQFPVLGSTESPEPQHVARQTPPPQRQPQQYQNRYNNQQRPQYNMYNPNNPDLTPEERERLLRRQEKVSRITKYSGFMNPRDKDFVTRVQLSQIFSEDPYNEDFYYQVYKVINNQGTNHIDGMSAIAQNYLEQSGHRLGGKHRRADVALQRMQQQVSKAVTVAKERRPKQGILTKEGALGKVSFGTLNKPRTTLVVDAKEGDIEIESNDVVPSELKFSKSSRKFHLYLIEKLYGITLRYESMERENKEFDRKDLLEVISKDDSFVYIFNYDKGLKLFPRFFRFLSYEEKLITINAIFTNLQKIDIILKSSYKSYEDSIVPAEINKKLENFQTHVSKNLVLFLSEAKFSEVLNLLIIILTQNNLLFLCTTKLGLSFITISISRLELIKQEFAYNLSAEEVSTWSQVYDKLFEQLEGKLIQIFPPSLSSANTTVKKSDEDDSYIWQFLASLSLAGKLNHQRIIVDEIRDEIFGVQAKAKNDIVGGNFERANILIGNLNLFLNVMGLKATEDDISELK